MSGRAVRCAKRPLIGRLSAIASGQVVMLDTLMGPPKHKVPSYDAPAHTGKEVHPGMPTGFGLEPVHDVFQAMAQYVGNGTVGWAA